jgi:sulfite reductase (NADPH) flavoprotein alpha-component
MSDYDMETWALAGLAVSIWLALTLIVYIRYRVRQRPATLAGDAAAGPPVLILWASQTGIAEQLASRTAQSLRNAGVAVTIVPLARADDVLFPGIRGALFIASTTGEGDAPDGADLFLRRELPSIAGVSYALLALGDSSYEHFCGFGHRLDRHLRVLGAAPLLDPIEVDNGDAGALRHWQQVLPLMGAARDLADWTPPDYTPWRLVGRELINPGSAGSPVYHIRLEPEGELPGWEPGAIVEIYPGPAEEVIGDETSVAASAPPQPHREYSIASIPSDGGAELVVRLRELGDGGLGLGSGWLCRTAPKGVRIAMRIRENSGFAPPPHPVPMIMIGNGSGIAGLRSHIKARPADTRNWLIFGERNSAYDSLMGAEIADWIATGHLERCDLVFSRDGERTRYVRHALAEAHDQVMDWVLAGCAIYVCGSLKGMAGDVDEELVTILGRDVVDAMIADGRYRRDVY